MTRLNVLAEGYTERDFAEKSCLPRMWTRRAVRCSPGA